MSTNPFSGALLPGVNNTGIQNLLGGPTSGGGMPNFDFTSLLPRGNNPSNPGFGIVPPINPVPLFSSSGQPGSATSNQYQWGNYIGGGARTVPTISPGLTQSTLSYLLGQLGQGVTPFNLSTLLPSGGQTQPGQLTAPLNDVMSMLQSFYTTGTGGPPGSSSLESLATTGDPINVTPEWQAMVASMKDPIQQQLANLREQFAFGGGLNSSSFGNAASNYLSQTALNQQALLGQLSTQAQQQAVQNKLAASTALNQGETAFGTGLQGLDQQAIQNLYQEFIRTQPQYNPLMNMIYGGATTFPPTYTNTSSLSGLAGVLGGAGTAAEGLASLLPILFPTMCWVARAVYGDESILWVVFRDKMLSNASTKPKHRVLLGLYIAFGPWVAEVVKKSTIVRSAVRKLMNKYLED